VPRYVLERPTTIWRRRRAKPLDVDRIFGNGRGLFARAWYRHRSATRPAGNISKILEYPACHLTTTTLYPFSRLSIPNMAVCPAIFYKCDLLLTVISSVNPAVVPPLLPVQLLLVQRLPKLAVLQPQLLLPATPLPIPQRPPLLPLPMQLPPRAPECLPRWLPPLDPSL
jgi:hypothetical protein